MAATAFISFGEWVQRRRLALDRTRPALARQVGCSPITIKKIERDERRPSAQIAALLADHLLIPDPDREQFMQMARGEAVAATFAAPDLISLPRFLRSPDEMAPHDPPPLVAREDELAQLNSHLAQAVAGKGGIVFITGEAGDGKTLLAQTFIRQSQDAQPDLVVATGNCNAYTGIGDPYLPFREILELLTGDIETRWAAGAISPTYAERLWRIAPHAVQALLAVGPDLVDTFLLGTTLLTRATATAIPESQRTLDQLRSLLTRHQAAQAATHLQQANLFAQYTRVLHQLARQQPLLLLIDDLQWADTGSISLLFHLSRHLKGQRILLIGIYRGAEVALGRAGERHPLEPILNELQQMFGEIHVRLNQAAGRRFVDAIIDCAPNRLGQPFRAALYKQTGGHPLFTVELLHGLQARGDLWQNTNGEWIERPTLDWRILPARVEGIIKERISRLPPPLQEILQVAGVVGETFGAETIAHVLGREERTIIAQLGTMLDQQQQLIKAQGSRQVGTQPLSHYGFHHILFQQYLYNSLDPSQRIYLHRAIADELVRSSGAQAEQIAPQLARHYALAGDNRRAQHYFMVAGKMAAAVYANTEAEAHYRQALTLAKAAPLPSGQPAPDQELSRLYLLLGRTLELAAHYDQAITLYVEMEQAAQARNDQAMLLASLLARTTIRTTVNFARDPAQGQRLLEKARCLAHDLGDQAAEAQILWNLLLLSAYTGGNLQERLAYGEQALALARALDLPEQLAFTLHDLFYAYAGAGQWEKARLSLTEARDRWQRLGNLPMLSETLMRLHWCYLVTGDYTQAIAYAEEAYRLGVASNNLDAQALSRFMVGFVHWERGEIEKALTIMTEDLAVAEAVNSLTPLIGTRADLGLLYGTLGAVERGLALADLASATAQEQLPILRFWPHAIQAMLQLHKGDLVAATTLMRTLADYRTVKAQFGYMPFMWIRVGLAQGEFALQQQEYGQAATLMEQLYRDLSEAGIWYLRPDVLHLKGRALLAQGAVHIVEAQATLRQALTAAERLGSRRALWLILVTLRKLAIQYNEPLAAETVRQEARGVVKEMAHHIQAPELRSAFLGSPQVQALLLPEAD